MLGVDNLFEIQGLNLTHNYTVQVSAYNLAGVGPRSEVVMMTSGPHGEFSELFEINKKNYFHTPFNPIQSFIRDFPTFSCFIRPHLNRYNVYSGVYRS